MFAVIMIGWLLSMLLWAFFMGRRENEKAGLSALTGTFLCLIAIFFV